jgi:Zn-dependent M16 (insulinase) family peptidase
MKKNQRYRGFIAKNVWNVEEIHVKVTEILHEKTGATVIHVAAIDDENLFGLCFKTYPKNHNGVAHILEHTTLCGSKKYPIHDPFFSMLRRSSNTFMNAFTAKLWTCYPASTRIKKDFYNLLEVYLDSVFHPLLLKTSFHQEGHRLEFDKIDDPTSPLKIKGVVYNEMKGVLSNPGSLFYRKLMSGLFPNNTYGFDSGGDPKEITTLSHADLVKFHEEYYHPSRCTYFFYGDIPIENHLDYLGEKVLDEAASLPPIPALEKCKHFKKPIREISYYPSNEANLKQQTFIGFGFLTMDIKDHDDLLGLHLLDSILMDTDASLLKYKLAESGLCVEADSAFDPDTRDIPYTIVCRGAEKENADALEKLLFDSLREIAEEGIPMHLIESSMHQLEFSRSEISYDYEPYGLELFSRIVLPYLQGGSPIDGLKIHSLFEKLSTLVAQKDYLPGIIKKYLLTNPHMYRLVMAPDPELLEKTQKEEEAELTAKQKKPLKRRRGSDSTRRPRPFAISKKKGRGEHRLLTDSRVKRYSKTSLFLSH